MLGNRNLTANKGDTTLCGTVDPGCPQGGVLSPLLWCLVVDELLHQLSGQGYHPIGYADDILIIVRGQHLDALFGVMQQALGIVDTWCKKSGLSVNPNKTEVVVFTRRYKWRTTRTLKLGGQQLKINEQAKYLEFILDKKLAWNEHLENKCKKLTATLWLCRRAIGRNWDLKPDTLLWIYTAILRSRLTYAAVVWWSRVELSTAKS